MSVFQELLNVPLVVRYPAAVESGQRIAEPVMLQDVYATLLGLAGVPVENAPDGGDRRESIVLPGIRGLRLAMLRVDAKFKYDDANPVEHRERVIDRLEQRGQGLDAGAAAQQRRRLAAIGEWQNSRDRP